MAGVWPCGIADIAFTAEISLTGETELHLLEPSAAVESGFGTPWTLLLVEGSVPSAGAVPAPSADAVLLGQTLRERLPDAIGATEAEIAAAEARLGVIFPDDLKTLYQVKRARWEDVGDDYEAAERVSAAAGCELFALDDLYIADAPSRHRPWQFGAMTAVVTPPDAAVQGLVGSPGWIAFGDNGGGDRLAVDLTPGPCGHIGQIIMLSHEASIGAELLADCLTDLVLERPTGHQDDRRSEQPPAVARVNIRSMRSVEAAAHPGLEVLSIGVWDDEPLSLAPPSSDCRACEPSPPIRVRSPTRLRSRS